MSESVNLAIIGISCMFPKADHLQAFWSNIKNGVDAITPIPEDSHWKIADYYDPNPKALDRTYAQRGGFLSPTNFNPMEFGIAPKDIEATDTTQLLGLVAAKQALGDAGYATKPFDRTRTSVILGVTGALELVIPLGARLGHPIWKRALQEAGIADPVAADVVQRISDGYVNWQENSFPGLLGNVVAGRIASRLDLGGTNCVVDAACASSMAALHLACLELQSGRADMAITGGLDTFNDIFMYMCFSKTPALSPSGDVRPFDRRGDGTILGEGLGLLVLKRLVDAERDGDRIYAVVKGLGSSSDGRGGAIYAPRPEGQKQSLERAYANAGVSPETIELIEAHGTGTPVGDATEVEALTEVFRAVRPQGTWAALGSVKSQIGHTKAAAGVAGLIKAALALDHKVLPPTIKISEPIDALAPGLSPFYLNTQKRPWLSRADHPRRAGVSAFGFGGTNFHCILEEYKEPREATGWDGDVEIVALSSDQLAELRSQLKAFPFDRSWTEVRSSAAASRRAFRTEAAYRMLLPITKETASGVCREAALAMLEKHPDKSAWSLPSGVAFGSGPRTGKLGALFPGQGSQYVGMFRDLACQFPGMLEALTTGDRIFAAEHPECGLQRLSDFIYPHPGFTDAARRQQEEALKATEIAQPALGAVSLGALNVVTAFGVAPEAAAGHSYGELLALCGAGRLEPDSLHLLSNVRGRLMASGNGHGDRGAMLAVQAPETAVIQFVREEQSELVIANRNSPSQFVLAGPRQHIEEAAGTLAKRSIRARLLPVSAAFHSSLVADARTPFAAVLERIPFALGRMAVYANTTARAYPADATQARELLASQIINPVDFVAQIETMFQDGVTCFIELGPGHVLTDLVQAILPGREVTTIALDASHGGRSGVFDLAVAFCRLAASGHRVDLPQWDPGSPAAKSELGSNQLTVPISGANYRSPAPRPARPPIAAPVNSELGISVKASAVQPSRGQSRPLSRPSPSVPGTSQMPKSELAPALKLVEQGLLSLQKLQEQTAQLHRQFLEGQDSARRSIESLLAQRREFFAPAIPNLPAALACSSGPEIQAQPAVDAHSVPSSTPLALGASAATGKTNGPAVESTSAARVLLEVVAEKTGYPVEMLSLAMGLDTDLGIDSIKRVEILAALRGRLPAAPEVEPEHLGRLQTLRDIVDFLTPTDSAPADAQSSGQTGPDQSRVSAALLRIVAEKTGYPVEMLNLDMGLDSDLGVDSIKRVEIMAALRSDLPDAPEIKPEHLGTLQTLRQIVEFLEPAQTSAEPSAPAPVVEDETISQILLEVVAEKTGYPVEMLNLDMGLDSDLGIDSIKRVEIMAAIRIRLPQTPEIEPQHLGALQTLRQVVDHLLGKGPNAVPAKSEAEVPSISQPEVRLEPFFDRELHRKVVRPVLLRDSDNRPAIRLPKNAVIWLTEDGSPLPDLLELRLTALGFKVRRGSPVALLTGLDREEPSALVILWPLQEGGDAFLKSAFRLIQIASPALRQAAPQSAAILLTVSRLDGSFGFGALNGKCDPTSGGLAGLVKTAHHEWPGVHCKALDVNPEMPADDLLADQILEEMFRDGPIEVGLSGGNRLDLKVEIAPFLGNGSPLFLTSADLIVVTGGGRGITAAVALELARRYQPKLALIGRSELADEEEPWLRQIGQESEIKKALLAHADGDRSPKQIEAEYRQVMAQREIRNHLASIKGAGATAIYRTADVRDAMEVDRLFAELRLQHGAIRGLVHGAGVLADKRIEEKTPEQFGLVYDTKVAGLRNLLTAAAKDDLKLLTLFSSYTGRFGRLGQIDYAAANEVLNKIAQVESRRRPHCRVVSFNWGPWNGGMVSEGLRGVFAREGVGLIEPKAGAQFFLREISARSEQDVEVLAMAPSLIPAQRPLEALDYVPAGSVAFEREVSVETMPCLESHVINGRAVLPSALMVEWLAQGAVHANPGLLFQGLSDFRVLKGLVLDSGGGATVSVLTGTATSHQGLLRVPVELLSQHGGRRILHARATISLAEELALAPAAELHPRPVPSGRNGETSVYNQGLLFHGPHFHSIKTLEICSEKAVVAVVRNAPAPKKWLRQPLRPTWLSDPLVLDASFQMMILWSWQYHKAASLPCAIKEYRQFVPAFPAGGSRIAIRICSTTDMLVVADIQFWDLESTLLAQIEGYECVLDAELENAFRLNRVSV